jgi:hypothetical protein
VTLGGDVIWTAAASDHLALTWPGGSATTTCIVKGNTCHDATGRIAAGCS